VKIRISNIISQQLKISSLNTEEWIKTLVI